MAKPCKAILIDPHSQTVQPVEWNGDYKHIYELTGCDCYDVARINKHGDGVFVDDEGLFKEEQAFFLVSGYPQPLAGKGLILGVDEEGESVEPKVTLERIADTIRWVLPVKINGDLMWIDHTGEAHVF